MLVDSLLSSFSYEELFEKGGSVSLHHRNLRILASEIFKIAKEIFLEIMNKVFPFCSRRNTNLRQAHLVFILFIYFLHFVSIVFIMAKNHLFTSGQK